MLFRSSKTGERFTEKITKEVIADQTVQLQIPTHEEIIQNNS